MKTIDSCLGGVGIILLGLMLLTGAIATVDVIDNLLGPVIEILNHV